MKAFFQEGIQGDVQFSTDWGDTFCVKELENPAGDPYIYPGDSIKYELDGELVILYDKLRDLFFADTDKYYAQLNLMPNFVQAAGQDSDCGLTADYFCKLINKDLFKTQPDFTRHLYLVDCQYLIGTIQNLISGMEDAFVNYYVRISDINGDFNPEDSDTTYFTMSQPVRSISSLIESYFTKAYSILDMFCKLTYEFEQPMDDFSCYKKMKSADVLWGERKKLKFNGTQHTVFEKCDLISKIEALRNELIHNGSWELNPKVFVVRKEGIVVERFMLFPDMEQGHLATVKNRRHFFGSGVKVNDILPKIHLEYMERIQNTAKALNQLLLL